MSRQIFNLEGLGVTTFTNADTVKASSIGATTTVITNGTMYTASDATLSTWNIVFGCGSQSVSGTTYFTKTITATDQLASSFYFKLDGALITSTTNVMFVGSGATRMFNIQLVSTEQYRVIDFANATAFTSTFSGGFLQDVWYRIDTRIVLGASATTAVFESAAYLEHGTSPLTGTIYNPGAVFNAGFTGSAISQIRHGSRAATGVAQDNIKFTAMSYDPASGAVLLGPLLNNAPPILNVAEFGPNGGLRFFDASASAPGSSGTIALSVTPNTALVHVVGLAAGIEPDPTVAIDYVLTLTESPSGQTAVENTTVQPLSAPTTTVVNVSAPKRPVGALGSNTWA